uniref:Reverse transcriptase domain-containing protein n=1 Tax=Tanacetum cinerariifolium TaxID=118510 RepID=A0A699HEM3_TANCI|nr:hypothetical protein [Tanacetum cinerariifolium]
MTSVKSYLHKYVEQPGPKQGIIFDANKEITNVGASVATKGNDRQQGKDVVDTGVMKMSNITTPNPFVALDDDEEEEVKNIWDESSHVDVVVVYDTCKKVCHRWKWTSNGGLCPKGSWIILGWNDDIVDIMIMTQTKQVMHVQINIRADNKALFCSFIYADNYYVDRRALWNNLVAMLHLCVINHGFFLEILMLLLTLMITHVVVMSLILLCGSNGILKKIDRIIGNLPLTNDFSGSFAIFRPYRISDHSPCNLNVNGCAMYRVVKRLKGLKTPLRKLLHDQGNLYERVNCLCVELNEAHKAIDRNPYCSLFHDEHAHYLLAFKEASLDEERFLRQKSKIKWLNAGDSNTAYFHNIVKSKCVRNRIEMVQDSSNVLHEGNMDVSAFVSHYEQFLGLEGTTTPLDDHRLFSRVLSDHKAEFMVMEVSDSKIKGALFSIGDDKAPSPDGFTVAFFKKSWDIMGGEVTIAIRDFFSNGKLLKELNHTIISLIPKVSTPTKINDYRPIYCCNVLFKCISKIIANRIKGYHGDLVSINQSTFVLGRLISDNILLTQELMHNYHRKCGPPRCAFKVDIQKAYDTVDWGFLSVKCKMQRIFNTIIFVSSSVLLTFVLQMTFSCLRGAIPILSGHYGWFGVPLISSRILYQDCGLGIRIIEDFNSALIATHIWCILINKESLWVQWIHLYKLKGRSFWDVPGLGDVIWGWRKLLQIRPYVRPFIWHKINNDRSTSMWFDRWADPCPLRDMLTVRNIVRSDFSLSDTVSDLISNGSWRWPHDWSSRFLNVVNILVPDINNDLDDVIVWRDVQRHVVWFPHCIPRHAIHMWLVIKEKLKTQDRLCQWDVGPGLVRTFTGISFVPPRLVDVLVFLIPTKGSSVSNVISWIVLAATTYCL